MKRGLLMGMIFALTVSADVFWRWPAGLPETWQQMYSSPFESQGHRGTLTVFTADGRLQGIEAALRNRHPDSLIWMPGEVMAWAVAVEGRSLQRYLVQPRPNGEWWIAAFESDLRTAPASGTRPDRHQLRDLPAPAGGTPAFHSHDAGNRASVEISEVAASPSGALTSLSRQLQDAGWTPSPVNTGGFRMFVKGNSVAFLGAHEGKDGITRVLRLHKPLGVK